MSEYGPGEDDSQSANDLYNEFDWDSIRRSTRDEQEEENPCPLGKDVSTYCKFGPVRGSTGEFQSDEDEYLTKEDGSVTGERDHRVECTICQKIFDQTPVDNITTIVDTMKALEGEDANWANTCLFVKELEARPDRKLLRDRDAETRKLRKEIKFLKGRSHLSDKTGIDTKHDDHSISNAMRDAGQLLGIGDSGGDERWAGLCPPFLKPSIGEEKESLDVQRCTSDHFYKTALPPRKYGVRGSSNCRVHNHSSIGNFDVDNNDRIRDGTRVGFEMLFQMELKYQRPWSITRWSQRFPKMILREFATALVQGGPFSRELHALVGSRHVSSISLEPLIEGYLDNLDDFGILVLGGMRNDVIQKATRIIRKLSEDIVEGRTAVEALLETWCILGHGKGIDFHQTEFWIIGPQKQCVSIGQIHLPSILVGLIIAQAVFEAMPNRSGYRTVINSVVFPDLRFTGREKREIIFGWGGFMGRIGLTPCTDSI